MKKSKILENLEGKMICFLQLTPLYIEEIMLVIENDTQALFEKFNQLGIKDYIDINRPNAYKK